MQITYLSKLCHGIKINIKNNSYTWTTSFSKNTIKILSILLKEGFIRGYFVDEYNGGKSITVLLKLLDNNGIKLKLKQNLMLKNNLYLSRSGLKRQYSGFKLSLISSKRGIISNIDAVKTSKGGITLIDII